MSYIIELTNKTYHNVVYFTPTLFYAHKVKDAYRFERKEDATTCIAYYIDPRTWDAEIVEYERQLGTYFSTYNKYGILKEIKDLLLLPIYIPKLIYYMIKNNIRRIKI